MKTCNVYYLHVCPFPMDTTCIAPNVQVLFMFFVFKFKNTKVVGDFSVTTFN